MTPSESAPGVSAQTAEPRLSAPMTLGQLSVLRSLQFHSYRGVSQAFADANIDFVWPLPDGSTVDEVRSAWAQLVQCHESLRTVYDFDRPDPVQVVEEPRGLQLPVTDLDSDSSETARSIALQLTEAVIPIDREHSWRAVITTYRDRPRYLALALHHIAVDGVAIRVLEEQFGRALAGERLPRQPQPVDLALEQSTNLPQHQEALDHWVREWPGFSELDCAGNDHSVRSQAAIHSLAGLAAARSVSAQKGISVQGVFLAATFVALSATKKRHRLTLGLMSSNRFDQRWESVVTSMSQLAPITVVVRDDELVDDFLQDVYVRSIEAYDYGAYNVDALRQRLTAEGVPDPEPKKLDCYFNFYGDSGDTPRTGELATTAIEWQRPERQTGARFNIIVATDEGVHLVVRASRDYLPEAEMAGFLGSLEAALVSLAEDAPATIADIATRPLRPTPPPDPR